MAEYELFVLFLRVWFLGFVIVALYALSDVIFREPHSLKVMLKRWVYAVGWPITMFSYEGRRHLLGELENL